jgi:hypothetical protein
MQDSPTPIGQGRRRGDAHIGGYYVLVYADTTRRTTPDRRGRERSKGIGAGQSEGPEPC